MRIIFVLLSKSIALSGFMLLNIVVAKMYGAASLGVLANFMVLATACSIVIRFGSDNDLLKNVGSAWRDRDLSNAAAIWRETWVFFLIRLALLIVIATVLFYVFGKPSISPFFCVSVLLGGFLMAMCYANSALLRAVERYVEAPLFEPGTAFLIAAILLVILGWVGESIGTHRFELYILLPLMFLCVLAGVGYQYATSRAKMRLRLKPFESIVGQFTDVTRRNAEFFVAALVVFSLQWITLAGMNLFGDISDVGYLQAALTIGSVVGIVITVINSTVASDMAHAAKLDDIDRLRGLYRINRLKIIMVSMPLIAVIGYLSPLLLSLFGADFTSYQSVLYVVLAAFLINVATGPVGLVLSMSGYERQYRRALLIGAAVGIVSTPYFIGNFGVLGAGWVFFIIMAIQNCASYLFVRRFLDIRL